MQYLNGKMHKIVKRKEEEKNYVTKDMKKLLFLQNDYPIRQNLVQIFKTSSVSGAIFFCSGTKSTFLATY